MDDEINTSEIDEEVVEIMKGHSLDKDEAEEVVALMDELGLDADEAIEVHEAL